MNDKHTMTLEVLRKHYTECQVIDTGRSILIIPPANGCYGLLPLELPTWLPVSSYCDEQALSRELATRTDCLTRALPDIGRQTLNALDFGRLTHGTAWEGAQLETFLRFGIISKAEDISPGPYRPRRRALKVVPPQYATEIQIILRTRSNGQLETLAELLQHAKGYKSWGWHCSYERVRGYNHIFGTIEITRDLVEIRDQMVYYWDLVNGPWSNGQAQRQYINRWMSGVDFR